MSESESYKIIGAELSPFSVKVRSYFRFKAIPHQWIPRSLEVQAEYADLFKVPIIPLVVSPEGQGMQDSTPVIERLEEKFPDPAIHPDDTVLCFLSCLLEEFADEWANKWMFHYRWARPVDRDSAALKIVRMMKPGLDEPEAEITAMADQIAERMVGRVWFVGSSEETAGQIEEGFQHAMGQLDDHLAERSYLLGERPSFGDFGLFGQIYNAITDPTPGALVGARYQHVLAWAQRMLWPCCDGEFEPWESLAPTLTPFLKDHVGARFLPWTVANQNAIVAGEESFSVELAGQTWSQKPQKYHAKSLETLRDRYAAISDRKALDEILSSVDCLAAVVRPT